METVLTACGPNSTERSDCHTSGHSVGVREWSEVALALLVGARFLCSWILSLSLCGILLCQWLLVGAYLTLLALPEAPSWGSYLALPSPVCRYKYR